MMHSLQRLTNFMQFVRGLLLDTLRHVRAGSFQCQLAVTARVPEARFLGSARALPPGGPRRRHSMSTADFSSTSLWDSQRPGFAAAAVSPAPATAAAGDTSPWLVARRDLSPLGDGPSTEAMVSTRFHPAAMSQRGATAGGAFVAAKPLQTSAEVGVQC